MLSDNLKRLRKAKGWSQEELAIKLNVVRQTISKWETGLSVPDSEMLIRIAEELGTTVNILLGETVESDEVFNENMELKAIAAKLEILNEQFAKRCERQRKIWRTVFIVLIAIVSLVLFYEFADVLYYHAVMNDIRADGSVIGGYDGPTNIYVSNISLKAESLLISLIIAIISAVGIFKTRRK